jgi:hypothetical protein
MHLSLVSAAVACWGKTVSPEGSPDRMLELGPIYRLVGLAASVARFLWL